jgi:hypothetical protein
VSYYPPSTSRPAIRVQACCGFAAGPGRPFPLWASVFFSSEVSWSLRDWAQDPVATSLSPQLLVGMGARARGAQRAPLPRRLERGRARARSHLAAAGEAPPTAPPHMRLGLSETAQVGGGRRVGRGLCSLRGEPGGRREAAGFGGGGGGCRSGTATQHARPRRDRAD